jgi:hypothetical protein
LAILAKVGTAFEIVPNMGVDQTGLRHLDDDQEQNRSKTGVRPLYAQLFC